MYRSHWEITRLAHDRIAELARESQHCSLLDQVDDGTANRLTQLRHRLGIALIQLGQALADQEAKRGLPSPPSRPAIWGQPSF
jgi:hypothetical protein